MFIRGRQKAPFFNRYYLASILPSSLARHVSTVVNTRIFIRARHAFHAGSIHFGICLAVAAVVAALIFWLWFPWPYSQLTGGRNLFFLIVVVDVVCGPLLTFLLFSPFKSKRETRIDLGVVVLLQLAALGYGLHVLATARPVHVVFEIDRLRIVTAAEIDPESLLSADPNFQKFSWTGPTLISTRESRNSEELLESVGLSLAGRDPSLRPNWWQSYSKAVPQILNRAKPISILMDRYPEQKENIKSAIANAKSTQEELVWLPLTSNRNFGWVVLLSKTDGKPRGFIELDGF